MFLHKFIYSGFDGSKNLIDFLAVKLEISKKKSKLLLDKRLVFVNQKRIWIASYQLHNGDVIEAPQEEIKKNGFGEIKVLYHDRHFLIADKPEDILTNGPGSLENKLQKKFNDKSIRAAHRLDKDTSGAIIFVKDIAALERMKEIFKNKLIQKTYRVIVRGCVDRSIFTVDTSIKGEAAVTHVKVLKKNQEASYLEINTETGRTHQIRIHLSSIGYPVIGEREYDRKSIKQSLSRQILRQMLHAYKLSFIHPDTLKTVSVIAELPDDFRQSLRLLGLVS